MKAVLPLALIGALAVGTAYAAGESSSQTESGGQSGAMSSSHHQHMSQSEVKQIQGKLKQQGYDVGTVDGRLGKNTEQALRQFQEDKGIQATGRPDKQTLAALNVGGQTGTQQGQMPQGHESNAPSGKMGGQESSQPQGGEESMPSGTNR